VRDWNKYLPRINGEPRNVGRPLAASEAQVVQVLKLRQQGYSLRDIADETSLGLSTVRTIVAQKNGTDRTSKRHRQRIELAARQIRWSASDVPAMLYPVRLSAWSNKATPCSRKPKDSAVRRNNAPAVLNEVSAVVRRLAGVLQADNLVALATRLRQLFPNQRGRQPRDICPEIGCAGDITRSCLAVEALREFGGRRHG
jgi:hypothetical protein